jgi:hypothetical protein
MSETVKRAASIPGAILGLIAICACLAAFLYLCDWLAQPNTVEQMCGEAAGDATRYAGSAVNPKSHEALEAFRACLARFSSSGAYRARQGWGR